MVRHTGSWVHHHNNLVLQAQELVSLRSEVEARGGPDQSDQGRNRHRRDVLEFGGFAGSNQGSYPQRCEDACQEKHQGECQPGSDAREVYPLTTDMNLDRLGGIAEVHGRPLAPHVS